MPNRSTTAVVPSDRDHGDVVAEWLHGRLQDGIAHRVHGTQCDRIPASPDDAVEALGAERSRFRVDTGGAVGHEQQSFSRLQDLDAPDAVPLRWADAERAIDRDVGVVDTTVGVDPTDRLVTGIHHGDRSVRGDPATHGRHEGAPAGEFSHGPARRRELIDQSPAPTSFVADRSECDASRGGRRETVAHPVEGIDPETIVEGVVEQIAGDVVGRLERGGDRQPGSVIGTHGEQVPLQLGSHRHLVASANPFEWFESGAEHTHQCAHDTAAGDRFDALGCRHDEDGLIPFGERHPPTIAVRHRLEGEHGRPERSLEADRRQVAVVVQSVRSVVDGVHLRSFTEHGAERQYDLVGGGCIAEGEHLARLVPVHDVTVPPRPERDPAHRGAGRRVVPGMVRIGYYVHHHGRGHEDRFRSISAAMGDDAVLVPISQRPIAGGVLLPSDVPDGPAVDHDAGGYLHWAPLAAPGSTRRLKTLVDWLDEFRPTGVVVDVSVEALLACRLAGIRTMAIRQHGDRSDVAHRLGYATATRLLAPFPAEFDTSTDPDLLGRTDHAGFIAPPGPVPHSPTRPERPIPNVQRHDAVVLWGCGGGRIDGRRLDAIAAAVDGTVFCAGRDVWPTEDPPRSDRVVELGWVDDPRSLLSERPLVVGSSGNNGVALAASTGCPFVAVPQPRPFDEQLYLARALDAAGVASIAPAGVDACDWRTAIGVARDRSRRWSDVRTDGADVAAAAILRHLT